MSRRRALIITADDFGIGPETTRGILDLAARGVVTSTALIVNSPHAPDAVRLWRKLGGRLELGWHACLTLDAPISPPEQIPTLVTSAGRFHDMAKLFQQLMLGRVNLDDVRTELAAQWARFTELVGTPPTVVNGHHHVHVWPRISRIVRELLSVSPSCPYVRRVVEPWQTLVSISGNRSKRLLLSFAGRWSGLAPEPQPAPVLAGLGGANGDDPRFFRRWLGRVPGRAVELICHPGYQDDTLTGRDERNIVRLREWEWLRAPEFLSAIEANGFELMNCTEWAGKSPVFRRSA